MCSQAGRDLTGVSHSHNPHRGPLSPGNRQPCHLSSSKMRPRGPSGLGSTLGEGISEVYRAGRAWESHWQVVSIRGNAGKPATTHGSRAQPSEHQLGELTECFIKHTYTYISFKFLLPGSTHTCNKTQNDWRMLSERCQGLSAVAGAGRGRRRHSVEEAGQVLAEEEILGSTGCAESCRL